MSGEPSGPAGPARLEVSPDVVRLVPAEFAKRHRLLPLELRRGALVVATAVPGDERVIDDIRC